jgi:hypothetical protein
LKLSLKRRLMRSSFVKFSMLTCFGFLDCFYTIGGQLISGIDIEAGLLKKGITATLIVLYVGC